MKKKNIIITVVSILLSIAYATYFIFVQGNTFTLVIGIIFLVIYLTSLKEKKDSSSLFVLGSMADDGPKTDSEEFNDQSIRKVAMGNIVYLLISIVFLILSVAF